MRLRQKYESLGRTGNPFLQRALRCKPAVRVVNFNRVQARGVIGEKLGAGKFFGIKRGLPGAVSEPRSSAIEWSVRHKLKTRKPVVTLFRPVITGPVIRISDETDPLDVLYAVFYWNHQTERRTMFGFERLAIVLVCQQRLRM